MKTLLLGGKRWLIQTLTENRLVAVPADEGGCEDLRAERLRLGLGQRAMAMRLGISQGSYSKLERGQQKRNLAAVLTLARKLQ